MPSVSVLSEFTFNNWGPLTTTWTPPTSCQSVETSNLFIAATSAPGVVLGGVSCAVPTDYWSCYPAGTITNAPTATSWYLDPSKIDLYEQYYSPGLYCPSGWGPVGTASRNGTKTVEWNGAFAPATPTVEPYLFPNLQNNVFLQVLDPSETALMCCPTSMTPGPRGDICYSTVPDYTPTTTCRQRLPSADYVPTETKSVWWYGTTVDAEVQSFTTDAIVTQIQTSTLRPWEVSQLVGVTGVNPITLVHQPSDISTSNPATTSNPAARLSPRSSNRNVIGAVLGITAAGMVMGAAIVLPW